MPKFVKLHAQQGSDEANHAGVSYRVDNEGNVNVPEDAVAPLMSVGGFIPLDDGRDEVPDGLVALKHNVGAAACSWSGKTFLCRPEDGVFFVPCAAAADLFAHGFVGAGAPVPAESKLKIPPK